MLILASKSPRRRELLKMLDMPFKTIEVKGIEETYPADLNPEKVPEFLSVLKASAYKEFLGKNDILITADTVVILDGNIIGKPKDLHDAKLMLRKLSGNAHHVVTGVTLSSVDKSETFSVKTEVKFDVIDDSEIDFYVDHYHPLDKAGAYGIQEWIGAVGVASIEGSFYNVMGLPVHQLYRHIQGFTLENK